MSCGADATDDEPQFPTKGWLFAGYGSAALLTMALVVGIVMAARDPSPPSDDAAALSASTPFDDTAPPTLDETPVYLERVMPEWQAIEAAWTAPINRDDLMSEENEAVVEDQLGAADNARRLQLILRSLEPPPERAALLHEQLSELVIAVIAHEEAMDRFGDAPPFGLFGDTPGGVEKRTSASNDAGAAMERIADLIPQIQAELDALST